MRVTVLRQAHRPSPLSTPRPLPRQSTPATKPVTAHSNPRRPQLNSDQGSGGDLGDQGPATARVERLQDAMARARGTASSADGSVTVVVGANGVLHAITVSEPSTLTARRLADVVVELHKLAFTRAGDAVREAIEQLAGTGSATDTADPGVDAGLGAGANSEIADGSSKNAARQQDADHSRSDSRGDTDNDASRSSLSDTGQLPSSSAEDGCRPDTSAASSSSTNSEPGPRSSGGYSLDADSNSNFDSAGVAGVIESVAEQDDPMHHVIQPFARPDDDNLYFTVAPQLPRPRRTPLPAENTSAPNADWTPVPPPRLMDDPSTDPAFEADEQLVVPEWLDPQFPALGGDDDLYPIYDSWDDWDVEQR
ncbi:YbaB/EbfC family nucleoid-associated protein [Nocardia sp. NPDC004654]|uniref:YbaB/EbfC family nucleoid-associated protein n=1 Tax=Nocardia sp. NPDC004654 TaxID=3154776 RepID=UPI0033A165BE